MYDMVQDLVIHMIEKIYVEFLWGFYKKDMVTYDSICKLKEDGWN